MKVLFIPLVTEKDPRDVFPVGYAALMNYLRDAGHDTDIIFPRAYHLSNADIADYLLRSDASVLGLGGTFFDLKRAEELTRLARDARPDMRVVIGGPMVTYSHEIAMEKTGADYGIRGDGEHAIVELTNHIREGNAPHGIPGLVYRRDGEIIDNGLAVQADIEIERLPDWRQFPMHYYLHDLAFKNPFITNAYPRSLTWVFSRGCTGKCNFCTPGGRPRFKTIPKMIDALKEIHARFQPSSFYFSDNIIGPSKKYIQDLCEAMIKENLRFDHLFCNLRADLVDARTIKLLKLIGVKWIGVGKRKQRYLVQNEQARNSGGDY